MSHEFADWLNRQRAELAARRGRKVPQQEVAEAAGISRSYYGFLEAGFNPTTGRPVQVDRDLVGRLAQALEADTEDGLRAAGFGRDVSDADDEVIRRLQRLTPEQAEVVRRLLDNPQHLEALRTLGQRLAAT